MRPFRVASPPIPDIGRAMTRGRQSAAIAGLGGLAAFVVVHAASANGRFPHANQLVVDPAAKGRVALRATFGLLLRDRPDGPWTWACERAVGFSGTYDPPIGFTAGGALVSG